MKLQLTAFLIFQFCILSQGLTADTCSAEKLIGSCNTLKNLPVNVNGAKELNLPKFDDGSTIYNDPGLKRSKEIEASIPSPSHSQRALDLSEKIRKASQELVVGDTREEHWSAEQKAMIERLKSVRVRLANSTNESCNSSPVSKVDPNANYHGWTHTLTICPPAARLATPAFLMLMAHEFGHVVSPCAMNRDLYKIDRSKIDSSPTIEKCLGEKNDIRFAQTMFPDGAGESVLSKTEYLSPRYKSVVSKLAQCGALIPRAKLDLDQGGNVFRQLTGCLQRSYAINHSNYLKRPSEPPSGRRLDAGPPSDAQSQKCMGIFEEHFAEAIGAKLFANMLQAAPGTRDAARVGLVQMAGYACGEVSAPKEDPGMRFRYPTSADRVQIQMSDGNMQTALGCKIQKSDVCTMPGEIEERGTAPITPAQKGVTQ